MLIKATTKSEQSKKLIDKKLQQLNVNDVSLNETFNNGNAVNYSQQILHTAPNYGYNSSHNSSFQSGSHLNKHFKNGLASYNNNGNVVKKVMGRQSSSSSSALKKASSNPSLNKFGGGMASRNSGLGEKISAH